MSAAHWSLDPSVIFLNHGSFGACPIPVLQYQAELRQRMERQPVQFFVRDLEGLLDEARAALGDFLGAPANDLVWVPNATTAVNAVLRSLSFEPGDELLTTDHEYNACRNVLDFVARRAGARVVVAKLPFPITRRDLVIPAVMERVTERTRLALRVQPALPSPNTGDIGDPGLVPARHGALALQEAGDQDRRLVHRPMSGAVAV